MDCLQIYVKIELQEGRVNIKCPQCPEAMHPNGMYNVGYPARLAYTAVSSEAWAKLRDWASVAGRGRLLLSGSVVLASLKAAVRKVMLQ